MHAVYGRFADPTDPAFADPATREQARLLGGRPRQYRTPEQVVAARIETYTTEYGRVPHPGAAAGLAARGRTEGPQGGHVLRPHVLRPSRSRCCRPRTRAPRPRPAIRRGIRIRRSADAGRGRQIDAAIADAKRRCSATSKTRAYSRVGRHGGRAAPAAGSTPTTWSWRSFLQHTSRDRDPQLHTHNAVLNRVICPDGSGAPWTARPSTPPSTPPPQRSPAWSCASGSPATWASAG